MNDERLREAIEFTAIPTLLVFAEDNAGVREAIATLRAALAKDGRGRVTSQKYDMRLKHNRAPGLPHSIEVGSVAGSPKLPHAYNVRAEEE